MKSDKPRFRPIKIIWEKSPKYWGEANDTSRTIWLDPRMSDELLLEIAAHETAHVILTTTDEETVDLLGKHIANVLTRCGFRRVNEGDE